MLRLYRINCKYPSEDWQKTEDYIDINVGTVLGEGRICKAWMGKISAPGDPLRNQNPILIKKLVRYKEEKDLIYKKRIFTYLNNGRAYSRMYNENLRGTSKVEGAYTDGCNYYILQVFYPGCTYREWESTSLLKEVDMIVKIIEVVKAYHDAKDENGKIMPQFIGDLKPENFYVPIIKNSETVDIVYFDFDVYDSATESGTHSYSNRYLSYLCLSDSEDARRRNDVTCIVLMLYERLFSTKKGVVLPRRNRIGKSRLPIGEYQFPDYVNAGKEVNRRLKNIFLNGLLQKYSTCEMLYKDIAELREILKVMDATEVIF